MRTGEDGVLVNRGRARKPLLAWGADLPRSSVFVQGRIAPQAANPENPSKNREAHQGASLDPDFQRKPIL